MTKTKATYTAGKPMTKPTPEQINAHLKSVANGYDTILASKNAEIEGLRQELAAAREAAATWKRAAHINRGTMHMERVTAIAYRRKYIEHYEIIQSLRKALEWARKLSAYRKRAGALGFQLEKADDYFSALDAALDEPAPSDEKAGAA